MSVDNQVETVCMAETEKLPVLTDEDRAFLEVGSKSPNIDIPSEERHFAALLCSTRAQIMDAMHERNLKTGDIAQILGVPDDEVRHALLSEGDISLSAVSRLAYAFGMRWELTLVSISEEDIRT